MNARAVGDGWLCRPRPFHSFLLSRFPHNHPAAPSPLSGDDYEDCRSVGRFAVLSFKIISPPSAAIPPSHRMLVCCLAGGTSWARLTAAASSRLFSSSFPFHPRTHWSLHQHRHGLGRSTQFFFFLLNVFVVSCGGNGGRDDDE